MKVVVNMVSRATKKEIAFLLKNIKKENKILGNVFIYILNNEVERFIYFGSNNYENFKYDKRTNITQIVKEYISGEYGFQETVDTIHKYVNDMVDEYNSETLEIEFYKKTDFIEKERVEKLKKASAKPFKTCCDELKDKKRSSFKTYCVRYAEEHDTCEECPINKIQRCKGVSCELLYNLIVENDGVIKINMTEEIIK